MKTWFLLHYFVLVIHQATQNLNYGPDLQSQGPQSMSIGTALFTLWFPVWCFTIWLGVSQDLSWCFAIGPRSYLNWCLAANRPHLLQQPLYSVNRYSSTPLVLFYPVNLKAPTHPPLLTVLLMCVVRLLYNFTYVYFNYYKCIV